MKRFAADRPKSPRRKREWSRIEENLVERGSITVWLDPAMIPLWEHPEKTGKPGRPARYHDAAITTGYAVKAVYSLPWRQTEGFIRSIFRLMGLDLAVPDSTTFSRRMPGLTIEIPRRPQPGEAVHIVIDSTGVKIFGAGEWHMHKHGLRKRRAWRKLHLLINAKTCEILEAELTDSDTHDGEMLPIFLEKSAVNIGALSADGAYDQYPCYAALAQRAARAVIPPRGDAVIRQENDPGGAWALRNANLKEIDRIGLEGWKHKNGYYKQSIAENGMSRYKTIFGERLSSRLFPAQKNEAKLNCIILNKMINLLNQA